MNLLHEAYIGGFLVGGISFLTLYKMNRILKEIVDELKKI